MKCRLQRLFSAPAVAKNRLVDVIGAITTPLTVAGKEQTGLWWPSLGIWMYLYLEVQHPIVTHEALEQQLPIQELILSATYFLNI